MRLLIVEDDRKLAEFVARGLRAERFAVDHHSIDDDFIDRLRQSFSDAEIFDLTICLSAFLGLGRTLRALRITETTLTDV